MEKLQKVTRAIECSFLERDQHRQALPIGPTDWIPFASITEAMIDDQNPGESTNQLASLLLK